MCITKKGAVIMYDVDDMSDQLTDLVLGMESWVLIMIIVAFFLSMLVVLIFAVLKCLGLYRMAKKVGYDKAWLAWIPYANIWLQFALPTKEFKLPLFNKELDRTTAFIIYLAITFGGSMVVGILELLPFLGILLGMVGYLAVIGSIILFLIPVYKDLFLLFYDESKAQGYMIACVICTFVMPIVPAILMLITGSKTPREYQVGYNQTVTY